MILALTLSDAQAWALVVGALFSGLSGLVVALRGLRQGQQTNETLTNGHDQMVGSITDLTRQLSDAGIKVKPRIPPTLGSGVSGSRTTKKKGT